MNKQKNLSLIELGGHIASATNLHRLQATVKSPSRPNLPLPSRQSIESTHKIPHKSSPTKYLTSSVSIRSSVARQNDQSFTQLESSKFSNVSRNMESRPYLGDRMNRPSPQKQQIVRIVHPDRSRSGSRGEPTQVRQVVISPAKVALTPQISQNEVTLERKLKILESRIGQLHREKQQSLGKVNEENRKLYHENSSLKHKLNELVKVIERREQINMASKVTTSVGISSDAVDLENSKIEVKNLKNQIKQLEKYVEDAVSKANKVSDQKTDTSNELSELFALCQSQKEEMLILTKRYNSSSIELEQSHEKVIELEVYLNEWKALKEAQTEEVQSLKSRLNDCEQLHEEKVQKLQTKVSEYENAYNENQSLISQLEEQIRSFECQEVNRDLEESKVEESKDYDADLVASECMELETNFEQAILEREEETNQLKTHNHILSEKVARLEDQIQQMMICEEEKTTKLESASLLLERTTVKFEEMTERYSDLTQRYEEEKTKMNKSEGFQGRCKKCDDLLKTVLRLNNQLNPKKKTG